VRVPLRAFFSGVRPRVYSIVARVPYAPIDIDLGRLARGEWNALTDRFRLWYLPGDGPTGRTCYVMVRKLDWRNEVMTYAHLLVNLEFEIGGGDASMFTAGVMSNDDVRARSTLNAILDIPPSFHRRSELMLVEHRWRNDPNAVCRFTANVHSALAHSAKVGSAYAIKFELPPGGTESFRKDMGAWWKEGDDGHA
jgi:hypothetical protein